MPDGAAPILDVSGLKTVFTTRSGEVHAVNSVSFNLAPGELLGVVGESGSGKSVTMMSLIGLLPSPPAEIRSGRDVSVHFSCPSCVDRPAAACQSSVLIENSSGKKLVSMAFLRNGTPGDPPVPVLWPIILCTVYMCLKRQA